jgi:hypothetical protein
MKNRNGILFAFASAGLISLLSFSAKADSSTPASPKETIQTNTERESFAQRFEHIGHFTKQRLAQQKYTRIVSLAGNRQDELATRKNEAKGAYDKLNDLMSAANSHNLTYKDFKDFETAAKAYSQANKDFIDLQKNILAQNGAPLEVVEIKDIYLYAAAPVLVGTK